MHIDLKISDIPDAKDNRYPRRITIALSNETYDKLKEIRQTKNKDTATLVRMLIEKFLKSLEEV